MLWLEKNPGLPPALIFELMANVLDRPELKKQIQELLDRKNNAHEQDRQPAGNDLRDWLEMEAERVKTNPPCLDYRRSTADMDPLFRKALEQASFSPEEQERHSRLEVFGSVKIWKDKAAPQDGKPIVERLSGKNREKLNFY